MAINKIICTNTQYFSFQFHLQASCPHRSQTIHYSLHTTPLNVLPFRPEHHHLPQHIPELLCPRWPVCFTTTCKTY